MPTHPSPRDWDLVFDGHLVEIQGHASSLELRFELPRLARAAAVMLHEVEVFEWRPVSASWDEDDVRDVAEIAAAGLRFGAARTRSWSHSTLHPIGGSAPTKWRTSPDLSGVKPADRATRTACSNSSSCTVTPAHRRSLWTCALRCSWKRTATARRWPPDSKTSLPDCAAATHGTLRCPRKHDGRSAHD